MTDFVIEIANPQTRWIVAGVILLASSALGVFAVLAIWHHRLGLGGVALLVAVRHGPLAATAVACGSNVRWAGVRIIHNQRDPEGEAPQRRSHVTSPGVGGSTEGWSRDPPGPP